MAKQLITKGLEPNLIPLNPNSKIPSALLGPWAYTISPAVIIEPDLFVEMNRGSN
jgi:hypothetical protein